MKKRRRNPTGTLLINAGKRGKRSGKRAKKSKRVLSIQSLLSRVSNPRKHKRRGKSGRFVKNPRKRHSRRASRRGRRNPIAIQNPRGRRGRHKMRGRRRNPISIQNPRRGRKGRGRRRNPSGVLGKVHNMGTGLLGGIRRMLAKIPLVGGILAGAVGTLGSAVGGALGVLPTHYAMKYIGGYIPPMLKPFGFTISGSILSAVIRALPVSLPYKAMLANGMVFAGGAVDAYRKLHGKEMDLGEDYDDAYSGADDFADGDDLGNDGSPLAAVEFADASLNDADYCGDDLSDAEIAAADLGRANYRRQFRKQGRQGESGAGRPGERWGWLIYAIGFDQFQQLSRMPREQRMDWIKRYKEHSRMLALQMLQQGMEPNVATAETHGLLVAAQAQHAGAPGAALQSSSRTPSTGDLRMSLRNPFAGPGGISSARNSALPYNQGYFAVPIAIQRVAEQGLWSTIRFAAGANIASFPGRLFSTALTQTGQGFTNPLSRSETNMIVGAFVPGGETYDVNGIAAEIYGATSVAPLITDVRACQRLGIFQWEFASQTTIAISPLSMVGSGGGIYGFTADTGTPITQANNGNGGYWCYQNIVVALPSTQSWALLLDFGSGGLASGTAITVTAETQIRVTLFNQSRIAVPVA